MKIIPIESWQPCDGIILEDAAVTAVRCSDNHVCVTAGPGAGKTELLAQKAAFLFQTNQCRFPKKILAISFKTDAAENLKERVDRRCGEGIKGRFVSMTYDAFAKSILDHFLYALPEALRPNFDYLVEDFDTINAAFEKEGYISYGMSSSKLKNAYGILLNQVELPISGDSIQHKVWPLLLHGFNGNKATLTFKMIMKLATYIVKSNPFIKLAIQMTYSDVFLDEFQDTTDIQYTFIQECFWGSKVKIAAVGDNKQRIMLWAGAVKTIFEDFCSALNPVRACLMMNHRSAPRLVELQKAMYESLKESPSEVTVSDKWKEEDGEIGLIIADDELQEARVIVDSIVAKINSGISPNDICILCKQLPQNYVSAIIKNLGEKGFRARIETEYQDLIKEPIVDLLIKFITCANNRRNPNEWTFVENTIAEVWGLESVCDYTAYDEMIKKINSLADMVKESIMQGMDFDEWNEVLKTVLDFINVEKLKSQYPSYRQGNHLQDVINKFVELFYKELDAASGDWQLAIETFSGKHSIPIMTIHKSKGLEYTAVYFVGLEDSAFWNFKNQPEEDRCAFFVALSRAKESITFTFCKRRNNLPYKMQQHEKINEFFDLLQQPGFAKVLYATLEN